MTSTCCNCEKKRKPAKIIQGGYKALDIWLESESTGDPINLTGLTEFVATFKKTDGSILQKKLTLSGVVVVDALGGHVQALILEAESDLLLASTVDEDTGLPDTGLMVDYTIASKTERVNIPNSLLVVAAGVTADEE